jgi:hypothetical protein
MHIESSTYQRSSNDALVCAGVVVSTAALTERQAPRLLMDHAMRIGLGIRDHQAASATGLSRMRRCHLQ